MKRFWVWMMVCMLLVGCMPASALAVKYKKMDADVPVWTQEAVRQYALDYVEGTHMERLWSYYDLQIRRYMPEEAFAKFLTDLHFLTGDFVGLGSYHSFAEPENTLRVHVLHLCMEKQDLDMYFTHKDEEGDWEIMAIEFVPAEKQQPLNASMEVGSEESAVYTEQVVTFGQEPYVLEGILTIPSVASVENPVPVCVLVHDFGPLDRDHTRGKTTLFADIADQFGEMGIATLRYDKRTFTYPDAVIETLADEVIDDALAAVELLKGTPMIDPRRIVVVGVGLGGMVTPRIAADAEGDVAGMIIIGASGDRLINHLYQDEKNAVAALPDEEEEVIKNAVRNIGRMKEEDARQLTIFGRNGYYYWESEQYDAIAMLKKLKLPLFYAQGKNDTEVSEADGRKEFANGVGVNARFATYEAFRSLNHLLMNDLSVDLNGRSQYDVETHLDIQVGRKLAIWVLNLETK